MDYVCIIMDSALAVVASDGVFGIGTFSHTGGGCQNCAAIKLQSIWEEVDGE